MSHAMASSFVTSANFRNVLYIVPHAALLILSAIGVVLAVRRRWSLLFPALVVGSCLLTYTLTVTAARFSIPFEPLQLCFAGVVVVEVYRWVVAE